LAQVQQEWKPYAIGNSIGEQIIYAQTYHSLRLRHDEDIKQALRYSMILVGLRSNNMPSDEEKFVLINFIRSNFGNLTPEEIKLAFEYAVAGKFNIDAKCYENFSCEYFGRIIKAYNEFAFEETRILRGKSKEIDSLPMPTNDILKQQAIETANMYADQLRKNSDFKWIYGGLNHLFDILIMVEIIDNIEIQDKTQAYKDFIASLVMKYSCLDENGKIKSIL